MDFPGQVRAKLQWVLLDRMRDVVPRVTDGWWNETRDSSSPHSSDDKSMVVGHDERSVPAVAVSIMRSGR